MINLNKKLHPSLFKLKVRPRLLHLKNQINLGFFNKKWLDIKYDHRSVEVSVVHFVLTDVLFHCCLDTTRLDLHHTKYEQNSQQFLNDCLSVSLQSIQAPKTELGCWKVHKMACFLCIILIWILIWTLRSQNWLIFTAIFFGTPVLPACLRRENISKEEEDEEEKKVCWFQMHEKSHAALTFNAVL